MFSEFFWRWDFDIFVLVTLCARGSCGLGSIVSGVWKGTRVWEVL